MNPLAGKRVAIANRAEIAVRIAATCQRLGAEPILLVGEPDRTGFAVRRVGRADIIGEAGSELDVDRVVDAARRIGADFLHPGYGFLSERAELAEACAAAHIRFVGPSAATLRLCGDKLETRAAAVRAGVAVLPASAPLSDNPEDWLTSAQEIGYPLLVKPAGAGGGRGLRFVSNDAALVDAILASRREVASSSLDDRIYLERALVAPRHVEVQVVADGTQVLVLGDRDCSVQRRHQKVIEEAPAPNLPKNARTMLHEYAQRVAHETELRGIATCEFLLSADGELAFLEVNPRIQVEHPVTELVTGVDLVEWQLLIAAGGEIPSHPPVAPRGHAIEARIYAEDPWNGFLPSPGQLAIVSWPSGPGIRVDAGYETDDTIPSNYDAMIAKIIVNGVDRPSALALLRSALVATIVSGVPTNLPWLVNLLDDGAVQRGQATTDTARIVIPAMPDRFPAEVAAVAAFLDRNASRAVDAWSMIGPWRSLGSPTVMLHGDDWEDRISLIHTPDGWTATTDSATAQATWRQESPAIWAICIENEVHRLGVIERGDALEVCGGGGRWLIEPGARPFSEAPSHQRTNNGNVTAPLPATVLEIHVEVGDEVTAHQPLVTLYAMKMELVCAAPASGVVEAINCRIRELVDADQVLVRVGPTTNSDRTL